MKTFIWDLDGTLLDSYKTIVDGLYDTYKKYGIELNKEEIHKHVITYSVSSFINKMYVRQLESEPLADFILSHLRWLESEPLIFGSS